MRHQKYPSCFFLLHRAGRVVVDDPAPAARSWWSAAFPGSLPAAYWPCFPRRRSADRQPRVRKRTLFISGVSPGFSGMRASSTMISAPSRFHDGAFCREIQRHDGDVLLVDVLPDVQLGPVSTAGTRAATRRDACGRCTASTAPAAGAWDPSGAARSGTRRCAPWRGIFPRRGARPPKAASKPYLSSACFSAWVFITSVCTAEPCVNGPMPRSTPSWLMCTSRSMPSRFTVSSRKLIISRNFQVVSTCRNGKGGRAGEKGLHRQVQHHGAVLADGMYTASPAFRTRLPPPA